MLITKSGEELVFALMDVGQRTNQDEATKALKLLYADGVAGVDVTTILVAVYIHIESKRKPRILNEIFPENEDTPTMALPTTSALTPADDDFSI